MASPALSGEMPVLGLRAIWLNLHVICAYVITDLAWEEVSLKLLHCHSQMVVSSSFSSSAPFVHGAAPQFVPAFDKSAVSHLPGSAWQMFWGKQWYEMGT